MKNWPEDEEAFIDRLAGIQSMLDQLQADFEATTWRKSIRVSICIDQANEEIELAIQEFTRGNLDDSINMANLAWLHVEFGRRLIDAETTEGLLGEGHFLELSEDVTTSAALLVKYFGRMEQQVIELRQLVKSKQESKL